MIITAKHFRWLVWSIVLSAHLSQSQLHPLSERATHHVMSVSDTIPSPSQTFYESHELVMSAMYAFPCCNGWGCSLKQYKT